MMHFLIDAAWAVVWAFALWFTFVNSLNHVALLIGRRTNPVHLINTVVPAALWAVLIVFWFD